MKCNEIIHWNGIKYLMKCNEIIHWNGIKYSMKYYKIFVEIELNLCENVIKDL